MTSRLSSVLVGMQAPYAAPFHVRALARHILRHGVHERTPVRANIAVDQMLNDRLYRQIKICYCHLQTVGDLPGRDEYNHLSSEDQTTACSLLVDRHALQWAPAPQQPSRTDETIISSSVPGKSILSVEEAKKQNLWCTYHEQAHESWSKDRQLCLQCLRMVSHSLTDSQWIRLVDELLEKMNDKERSLLSGLAHPKHFAWRHMVIDRIAALALVTGHTPREAVHWYQPGTLV